MDITEAQVVRLGDVLADMQPRVQQALEQGDANERVLRNMLDEQRAENTRMRRLMGTIDPSFDANPPRKRTNHQPSHVGVPRTNGTATGHAISMESAKDYVDEILRRTDEGEKFVYQRDVYRALGHEQSRSSAAFRYLRSIGFLRDAGRDKNRRGANRYAVMDREAYDKALAETREAVNA